MNNYNENSKEVQELKSLIQDYFNIKNKGRGELNNKNLLSSYLKDNENKSYILDKYNILLHATYLRIYVYRNILN
jgi:hypothetical protein